MKKYLLFLILIVSLVGMSGVVSATDYYVKTDGNDFLDGLTIETAWQHPSYAAQVAEAGDTIYLMDGTWYDEHVVFANSGTEGNPITMTAYNGTPTLDGVDKTGSGIVISYRSYINITGGLVIKNYYRGIYITHGTDFNISGITITSLDYAGMHLHGVVSNIIIDSTEITHTGHAAIWSQVPDDEDLIQHLTITNNIFDDNNHASINIHNNNHDVLIANNIISNAGGGAGMQIHNYNVKNITLRNNTLENCWRGIWLIGVEDCLVENNTISDSYSSHGIFLYTYSEPRSWIRNVTIRNNIVKNSSLYGIRIATYEADVEVSDILFENNSIEKVFSFEGANISNITVRNMADATRTFTIVDAVSNLKIEFTDGRTFKLNGDAGGHTNVTLTALGTYTIEVEGALATGNISGTVTNTTGAPIEGATVQTNGYSNTTNSTGAYTITNVPAGTHTVTASKTGYQSQSKPAEVKENQTTEMNFNLTVETTTTTTTSTSTTSTSTTSTTTTTLPDTTPPSITLQSPQPIIYSNRIYA